MISDYKRNDSTDSKPVIDGIEKLQQPMRPKMITRVILVKFLIKQSMVPMYKDRG